MDVAGGLPNSSMRISTPRVFIYLIPRGAPPPAMYDVLMLEAFFFRGRRGTCSEAKRVALRREHRIHARGKPLRSAARPRRHGPGHLNKIKNKSGNILETYYFCKYENRKFLFSKFSERRSTLFVLKVMLMYNF